MLNLYNDESSIVQMRITIPVGGGVGCSETKIANYFKAIL